MPLFTVAIPTYNRAKLLAEVLACLHQQTYQDFDIVISDNASADDTAETVQRFADARTRYIKHPTLIPPEKNWMACAEMTRTDWIVFHQDDDLLCPLFLDRCAAAIRRHPEIVMYGTDIYASTDATRLYGGVFAGFPLRHRWDAPQPRLIPGEQVAALNWFVTGFMPPGQALPTHLFRKHWYMGENAMLKGDHYLTSHIACEGMVAYESYIGSITRIHSGRACVEVEDQFRKSRVDQCQHLLDLFAEKNIDWQGALRAILPETSLEFREDQLSRHLDDDLFPTAVLTILADSIGQERGMTSADVANRLREQRRLAAHGGRLDRLGLPRPMIRAIRGVLSAVWK